MTMNLNPTARVLCFAVWSSMQLSDGLQDRSDNSSMSACPETPPPGNMFLNLLSGLTKTPQWDLGEVTPLKLPLGKFHF